MNVHVCSRASNCISKIVKHFEKQFKKIKIYLPINICYTVPLSLMYTKSEIKFYDIDYRTLYPDFGNLINEEFENLGDFEVVIFLCVIPYGNWDTDKISEYRSKISEKLKGKANNIFIMWDCALVFPTYEILKYIEKNCNEDESFIFSFSYAKPLELGFGSTLFTKKNVNHIFPIKVDKNYISFLVNKVDKKFKSYLNFEKIKTKTYSFICYNSELDVNDQKYIFKILEKIYAKEDFFVILRKNVKSSYSEILNKKIKNNKLFKEFFKNLVNQSESNLKIEILDQNPLSWRFNVRIDSKVRNSLIDRIFKEGAFASRLFPSLAKYLINSKYLKLNRSFPNASQHWQMIINIFNNQEETYNEKILKAFDNFFKKKLPSFDKF